MLIENTHATSGTFFFPPVCANTVLLLLRKINNIQPSVVFKARNHIFAALLVVALHVTVKGLSFRVTVKLKLLPVGEEKKSCPRA
jgi:hypothetical protein